MPWVIYQTKPNETDPLEDVWAKHWANCDIDREIEMCGKRELAAHLLPVLRTLNNPLIVESGCGVGAWVLYLQQQGFKNTIGVDNYLPALQQLEARGGRAVEGDVRRLPFGDDSVDVCLSLGVVEHFPENPSACIREMARILVPGGYMFLTVPYDSWMRRLVAHPVRWLYARFKRAPRQFFEYRFRDREIIDFCRQNGFEVLNCATDDYLPKEMSQGLWLDIPFFRGGRLGELNRMGAAICKMLRGLSPWLISSGVLVIARKPETN